MAKLTGQTIANSYDQLLIVDDSDGINANLQAVESGDTGGSSSALKIATNKVEVIPGSDDANAFEVSKADGTAVLTTNTSTVGATLIGALTVGVDDTGHDVKFFGATSGKYMLWDESADGLIVAGNLTVSGKGGNLFQVVSEVDSNQASSNSNSFAAKANPSPSITTTVLNSRVLVIGSTGYIYNGSTQCLVDFVRDVSEGSTTTGISGESRGLANAAATDADAWPGTIVFLDSPAVAAGTTITYQFCFSNLDDSSTVYLGHNDVETTLTLMEVV